MGNRRWNRIRLCAAALAVAAALWHRGPTASAQRLAIQHYDDHDGLASNRVGCIYQDAKGYLWFGTWDGLSRFDGYRFTSYGPRDGLERPFINAIAEDRQGRLWVGTWGSGVACLIDGPEQAPSSGPGPRRKKFVTYPVGNPPSPVFMLIVDAENTLWCGVETGLYRARLGQAEAPAFELVVPGQPTGAAWLDHQHRLWFGIDNELVQVDEGRIFRHRPPGQPSSGKIVDIVQDRQGRWLAATSRAVLEFVPPADSPPANTTGPAGQWKRWPLEVRANQEILSMTADSSGTLWVGTAQGLIKSAGNRQALYTTAHGLSDDMVLALREDREGSLWIGTGRGGVCRLSGGMIVSYTQAEGLPDDDTQKIIEARDGRIYVTTGQGGIVEIAGETVTPASGAPSPSLNGIQRRLLQDRRGDWWAGIGKSIFVYPGPGPPLRHEWTFKTGNPYPIFYDDPAGGVLVGLGDGTLYRFDQTPDGRRVVERLPVSDRFLNKPILAMMRDRAGGLWLATFGGLCRLVDGRVDRFELAEGLPDLDPRVFFQDRRGWLWIGLRWKGVSMTKDPAAARPAFVNYSTENGLASDTVVAIAEDDLGRIYLGTERGLDQLDPASGRIRHFTASEGLAGNRIHHCLTDRQGHIWVATSRGLSNLDPRAGSAAKQPPPIYLSQVQVGGRNVWLPETGARQLPELRLAASQNNVRVEYIGLSFQGRQALRYEHRLEGVNTDWGPPTEERLVHYVSLPPGRYRFMVRAVTVDGLTSPTPAAFDFVVLPPIWQRWWFLLLSAAVSAGTVYLAHRYRVARLVELERVRTRIAADLHDDIGASLSEVALLSEVLKQQHPVAQPESLAMLTQIADKARGLVDTMSDVVWSIDPRRDDLGNVVLRISALASDVLEMKGIACHLQTPPAPEKIKLSTEQRRHLYLIFKEAINNIVRHAECSHVWLAIAVSDGRLDAEVRDDGRGFSGTDPSLCDGHGLENMRARAAELGGQLQIHSAPGQGTWLTLSVPLK